MHICTSYVNQLYKKALRFEGIEMETYKWIKNDFTYAQLFENHWKLLA